MRTVKTLKSGQKGTKELVSLRRRPLRAAEDRAAEDRGAGRRGLLSGTRSRVPWFAEARCSRRARVHRDPAGGTANRLVGERGAAAGEVRWRPVGPRSSVVVTRQDEERTIRKSGLRGGNDGGNHGI